MIGSLRGTLVERDPGEITVEVGGIGYRVTVGPTTAVSLGDLGSEVLVQVHHHIREDAQTLYGFATRTERACFEALLAAHGVGPSLALAILSVHGPEQLALVVATDDVASLCLVPGVGKKTAARLLLELKAKLDLPEMETSGVPTSGPAGESSVMSDLTEALSGLGYGHDEIKGVLADLPDEGDVADLLRDALRRLAGAR